MTANRLLLIMTFSTLCVTTLGQQPSPQTRNDTTGACSQIIADNKGTINISCPGFSREQMRQMISILNRIEKDRLDPHLVFEKLDEISNQMKQVTKATQGLTPRLLSDESKKALMQWANGLVGKEGVIIQTQGGDSEAHHLGVEIQAQIKAIDMTGFVGYIDVMGGDPSTRINISVRGPKERRAHIEDLCAALRKSNIVVNEDFLSTQNPQNEPIHIVIFSKP
jgi:hypothetical protein